MSTWMTWENRIRRGISRLLVSDRYDLPDGSGWVMRVDIDEFRVRRHNRRIPIEVVFYPRENNNVRYQRVLKALLEHPALKETYEPPLRKNKKRHMVLSLPEEALTWRPINLPPPPDLLVGELVQKKLFSL